MTPTEAATADTKQWRKDLDAVLQSIKRGSDTKREVLTSEDHPRASRERSLAVTKLQEAIMWLGMDLKDIGETPNPYPHSYDPASPVIEPTSDGLKL